MALLGNTYLDLVDTLKTGDLTTATVGEVLNQLTPFLKDANIMSANKGSSHLTALRTGLPSATWGALYQGIPQSKGTYTSVEDTTGFLEGLSDIDERIVSLEPEKSKALRAIETQGFAEAFAQLIDSAIWYSNVTTSPRQFHGLSPRYNSLANKNVINGGGVGSNNCSIWFVTHGEAQTSVIVPKNITAGLQTEDMGRQRTLDALGNPFYILEMLMRQHLGVTVKDWRFNARIANIDVNAAAAGSVKLNQLMTLAYYALQGRRSYKMEKPGEPSVGRTAIYMNKQMLSALDMASTNATATDNFIRLTPMQIQGEEVQTWRGMPIRETDALLNTESPVV